MSRLLIIFGVVLVAVEILWPLMARLGLGRLPGDILVERENFHLSIPVATSLITAHHSSAERGGLGRERVAGGPHVATRGIEGPRQATETTAAVVGQWLVHPAAAGTAEPRVGLRLRRGSHV